MSVALARGKSPELELTVSADPEGGKWLDCPRCGWQLRFGSPWDHDQPGDSLGDLLDSARGHTASGCPAEGG